MDSLAKQNYRSELRQLNWDFTGESGSDGFAGYHWYPARYVPQVPGILIGYFSEPSETILDPFCGSGTTLVEAARSGRRSHGIDTNPIATLMARTKLVRYDDATFDDYLQAVLRDTQRRLARFDELGRDGYLQLIPNASENKGWYEDGTLRELGALWLSIESTHSRYRLVGETAFSSILRSCCSQKKHWGWICDNVKPTSLYHEGAILSPIPPMT